MEAAVSSSSWSLLPLTSARARNRVNCSIRKSTVEFPARKSCNLWSKNGRRRRNGVVAVVNDVTSTVLELDPAPLEVTWQIVVGTIAGFLPFVVAGIEFSKRIIAQRKCEECGGSGLVLREKEYFRCPECGGFLPWQSWKRFFSG